MDAECLHEQRKKRGKNWAFGFCPLHSFTLNVCPGFTVPLYIVLALDLLIHSSVFIINLQINYWRTLVCEVSCQPSLSELLWQRLDTSVQFSVL